MSAGTASALRMVAAAAIGAALAASGASAARIPWHKSFDETMSAARMTGKPVLVFVHMGPQDVDPRYPGQSLGMDYYRQMWEHTLVDPDVVKAAGAFECFELDLRNRENDELRDKLNVGPVRNEGNEGQDIVGAMYPLSVFLDPLGHEDYRMRGYLEAPAYVLQLQKILRLIESLQAVSNDPRDPVARRNLGRIYMEMYEEPEDDFYKGALENLSEAVKLDPDNTAGANYDARVDLVIFRLPDDPDKAFDQLAQLLNDDPLRKRRFEMEYYMGVAKYAGGHPQEAVRILKAFETGDKQSPYYDNEWTPLAVGALKVIRKELAKGG